MAGVLGWDEEQVKSEVDNYRARVEAERRSQEQDEDLTADSARTSAPDVRAELSDASTIAQLDG